MKKKFNLHGIQSHAGARKFRLGLIAVFLISCSCSWGLQAVQDTAFRSYDPQVERAPRMMNAQQSRLAASAVEDGIHIVWDNRIGVPSMLRGKNLGQRSRYSAGKGLPIVGNPASDAIAVLDNISGIMNIRDAQREFAAKQPETDQLGFQHVRANQTYQGLQVFGGQLIVHFDNQNNAYQVNGSYVPEIALDITPRLAAAQAIQVAANDLANMHKETILLQTSPELVVYAWNAPAHLAYALTLSCAPHRANAWRYWVDALDGRILLRYNDIKTATLTGRILDGEGGSTQSIENCLVSGVNFLLSSTSFYWTVRNISTNEDLYVDTGMLAFRTNAVWIPEDPTEFSAGRNFDFIQRYYLEVHGRASFNNANAVATANVHAEDVGFNAFWNGIDFTFGDGEPGRSGPLTVLDVCAHEYGHAVDQYTANLIYAYEPGTLNESFADISGATVEFWAQPDGRAFYPSATNGFSDWLLGEDLGLWYPAMRDMRNPTDGATVGKGNEQPMFYKGLHWYPGDMDNGGVHMNSGVMNCFFYLLCEGVNPQDSTIRLHNGTGTANGSRIAYRTLTVYCTPYTDFYTIRDAWLSAAQDLQDLNPDFVNMVAISWDFIGYATNTPLDFSATLNAPYLQWSTGGYQPWFSQTNITHDGVSAAQSGLTKHNQSSRLHTTVNGAGTLSFWWKVSSETNYDFLVFSVNGVANSAISGETPWQQYSVTLGAGTHNLTWSYIKDEADPPDLNVVDAGWLDQVAWKPNWSPVMPSVTATKGAFSDRVRVSWPAISGATAYRLYRHTLDNPAFATCIARLTSTLYDDRAAVPGTSYYYWLRAENCATDSGLSAVATGYRLLLPPAGLSTSRGTYTDKVRLTWRAALGATGYQIWRGTNTDRAKAVKLTETGSTDFDDVQAIPAQTYYYWLVSQKWRPEGVMLSAASAPGSGWRRSQASTDNSCCDYDGDGKADPAIYNRSSGLWTILLSSSGYAPLVMQLGGNGYTPIPQDYDGDGKTDLAVYSDVTGVWMVLLSASGDAFAQMTFGGAGYLPVPRDYDGDGKADPAVYHVASGLWQVMLSSQGYQTTSFNYGDYTYKPTVADYDNDGRSDPAIFHIRNTIFGELGHWLAILSGNAYATRVWTIGQSGQQPAPQDYDGDKKADTTLYDPATGLWHCWPSSFNSTIPITFNLGGNTTIPIGGDYDGDGKADPAVYNEASGAWEVMFSGSGYARVSIIFGGPGSEPAALFK